MFALVGCAQAPVVEEREPPDLVCEAACERVRADCVDKPYWQQCEADYESCLDGCD